ncbi:MULTISPECIES: MFS transporter [Streptomyces]|uniref:MFS transporter n=1 Tax=Streptomyces TaxID=1883 RepID=UPI0008238DF6|nr:MULTISPECIES: MFS transporter [Streptomyces]MCX4656743.1 MFS transporter [Streptomyces microflavus]WSS32559.1 MFS transporter [Streptomyces microflavus]WST18908.1 MFS transporter [Streptomyces microflavus]SCK14877.1 Predicted arabinose efflux permease, MFS family [Streptomyces sp. ScaeMP-e48]
MSRPGYPAAAAVFAIGMAGTTLPTPLYGLYREELGFSELMVTVVFAVYALGVIATLLLAGNVSDETGRRPVLLAALGFSAASALCFLFEGGLPALFAGRLLSGFAAGLLSGAATVTVMELAPPGGAARAGLAATAANMGGLGCGPLLAGLLAEYAPWPLRLPFVVHLALIAAAAVLTWLLPETVTSSGRRPRLRPQGLAVPPQVRGVFAPSALAAFAGFSLLGLFTAVAPAFVAETLDVHNLALAGLVVFSVFLASTAGQALMGRVGERRALPGGCFVLVAGLVLVAASLLLASLPLLVAGALCGGLGQGLAFRGAVTAISAAAPPEHRAATVSAFFVIAYLGISLPVVGVGALTLGIGLRNAGLTFAGCVLVLALGVGLYLARRPPARG